MIAFHYPPLQTGSGVERAHAFVRYLPEHGWEPLVLTVTPGLHHAGQGGADGAAAICGQFEPADAARVFRTPALDAAAHFAVGGRYPGMLALPDRWITWWLSAVPAGLRLIRRYRPYAIWSTYPIATAHLIGLALHRCSGLPWLAEFRDPMLDHDYPPAPRRHRQHAWIERQAVQRCAALVCATPGAAKALAQRHPRLAPQRLHVIANGYDEVPFARLERQPRSAPGGSRLFRLLHSGVVYPSERDPRQLFAAIARLRTNGVIHANTFRLVLRASGHDDFLRALMAVHDGLGELVELAPALPRQAALAEMLDADGLLVLQAANCNHQVPAKVYEYLRAQRPVLALTDRAGDTAHVLRQAGIADMAPLDDRDAIAAALAAFLHRCRMGEPPVPERTAVLQHTRAARTRDLASLLDKLARGAAP